MIFNILEFTLYYMMALFKFYKLEDIYQYLDHKTSLLEDILQAAVKMTQLVCDNTSNYTQ